MDKIRYKINSGEIWVRNRKVKFLHVPFWNPRTKNMFLIFDLGRLVQLTQFNISTIFDRVFNLRTRSQNMVIFILYLHQSLDKIERKIQKIICKPKDKIQFKIRNMTPGRWNRTQDAPRARRMCYALRHRDILMWRKNQNVYSSCLIRVPGEKPCRYCSSNCCMLAGNYELRKPKEGEDVVEPHDLQQ